MGKRGPAPTPTKILDMRGSWLAKTRSKEPRLQSTPAVIVAPAWLSEEAKVVWKQVVADLKPLNLLGHIDFHTLARYCTLQVEWKKAVAFVQQHGSTLTQRDKDGMLVVRLYPQARFLVALTADLLRLEHEFGMTPSARASIGVEAARGTPDEGKIGKERFFA